MSVLRMILSMHSSYFSARYALDHYTIRY